MNYPQIKNNKTNYVAMSAFLLIAFSSVAHLIFNIVYVASNREINIGFFINTYILLLGILVYFVAKGINKHFLIFCFYVCFFTFLMGQKLLVSLDGGRIDEFLTFKLLQLTQSEYVVFINLLYYSIIGVFLGYTFATSLKNKKTQPMLKDFDAPLKELPDVNLLNIVRVLFVISFVCAFAMQLKIVIEKRQTSYVEGYLTNVDINPLIKIGNFLFLGVSLFYLALKPKKIEMFAVLFALLLLNGGLQMFVGRRALLAQSVLFVGWYCLMYFQYDGKKIKWQHLALCLLCGLLIIVLFVVIEQIRSGQSRTDISLIGIVKRFFISTGGSDSVIGNTIRYKDSFPKGGITYLMAPVKDAVCDNFLIRKIIYIFTGQEVLSYGQSIEYLNHHDTFSHWLSYIVLPEYYLSGHGMGSSYIAEIFISFGVIGVGLFGLLLGYVIKRISKLSVRTNKYVKAIQMFFIYNLFVLPRGGVFDAAMGFIYLIVALAIVKLVDCMVKLIKSRKRGQ